MTHSKNDKKLQPGARPAPIDPDLSARAQRELQDLGKKTLPSEGLWALAFVPLAAKLKGAKASGEGVTLTAEENALLCRVIGLLSKVARAQDSGAQG